MDITILHGSMAAVAAFIIGVNKSGIKGLAIISVTLLAIVFESKASTGILMPLLMVGDVFAIVYYRRHIQWHYFFKLIPWMVVGVLLGVWVGKDLPEFIFKKGMAIIILLVLGLMVVWDQKQAKWAEKSKEFPWMGPPSGLAAGFATMVGNLAGPFTNIYFLANRLPKNEFIGTSAWLFFIINWFKLPFHIWVWGTINWETFVLDLWLVPFVGLGLWAGIRWVHRIPEQLFRQLIIGLTAIGAVAIFFR